MATNLIRSALLARALAAPPVSAQDMAPMVPTTDVLGAVGIGVAELAASTAFYIDMVGMQQLRTSRLGDLDEVLVGFPKGDGPVVVLMHWQNDATRKYDGTNAKLVFDVDDPAAVLVRIPPREGRARGDAGRDVGRARDRARPRPGQLSDRAAETLAVAPSSCCAMPRQQETFAQD